MPLKDLKARAEYSKAYAAKNRKEAYKRVKAWRKANPEKHKEHTKAYALKHPEKVLERVLRYKNKNLEKVRIKDKVASAKYRGANPELVKLSKRKYQKAHPGVVNAAVAKRKAKKLLRTPKWIRVEERWLIKQAYELASLRTKMFGFAWHVDHVIPLQGKNVSGLHVPQNLQVIPGLDNIRKKNGYLVL
jgi:hypothetical protein